LESQWEYAHRACAVQVAVLQYQLTINHDNNIITIAILTCFATQNYKCVDK